MIYCLWVKIAHKTFTWWIIKRKKGFYHIFINLSNSMSMVQTSLESLENLEMWLIFWKVRENLKKSGRKFKKLIKSWRSKGGFFDKADKPIFWLFPLKLKSKMCVLCFLHDKVLFIFGLFFNILISGVLIVNCVLCLCYMFYIFFST